MTDGYLMDADCIHGVAWYECKACLAIGQRKADAREFGSMMAAVLNPEASDKEEGPWTHTFVPSEDWRIRHSKPERWWTRLARWYRVWRLQ
jgi:hypothetical protein